MKKIIGCILAIACLIITIYDSYSEYNKHKDETRASPLIETVYTEANRIKFFNNHVEPMEIEEEFVIDSYRYTPVKMVYQTSAKTYMDYRAITNTSSAQYQFIHSDEITICEDGFLRDEEGFIGVAMGSYFGPIGSRYICHLDTGKDIKIVKVEAKDTSHTFGGFCGSTAYDIIEFVIDTKALWMQQNKWGNGYIFSGNFNNYSEFNGKIVAIDMVIEN